MRIYPAIDIQNGRCVRLKQGRKEDETIYADDPADMAARWIQQGAEILHVVDLDAAFDATTQNQQAIMRICALAKQHKIPVQLGGGIRDGEALSQRLSWGVDRVVIGTAALENPEFVRQAAADYPRQIVAGIDAKNGFMVTRGWVTVTETKATELGKKLFDMGIQQCVYTDIHRDGMMKGPNIDETVAMAEQTGMEIIASGGISTLSDIKRLSQKDIYGAIIGCALYENTFALKEAIEMAQ